MPYALENEVDAVLVPALHLLGPFEGGAVIAGIGFHPSLILLSVPGQDFLAMLRDGLANDVTEEVNRLFWAGQAGKIAVDDSPGETVVNKQQRVLEKAGRTVPSGRLPGNLRYAVF